MSRFPGFFKHELGSTMVESALSLTLLLMTVFGVLYCGWAMYTYEFVSWAAQQGVRYAVVRGSTWSGTSCSSTSMSACDATSANITSYVQSLVTTGISTANLTVTPSWQGAAVGSTSCTVTNNPGCLVEVQVKYTFSLSLPYLPASAMSFTATSEQSVQE